MTRTNQTQNTRTSRSKKTSPSSTPLSSKVPFALSLQRAKEEPHTLSPQDVVHLQRTVGNQRVCQLLSGTVQRKVGEISKPRIRKSNTVNWYDWTDKGFERSNKTIDKGTALKEARPTIYAEYAWVETEDGKSGYLRAKNLSVQTWGPELNPRYPDDKKYLDENKLFGDVDKQGGKSKDAHREWFLNQAVLMDAYRSLEGKDPETQKQLALAMLQSFSKGATVNQQGVGDPMGLQVTNFGAKDTVYHRSSAENDLIRMLQSFMTRDMGIEGEQARIMSDPMFVEVLAREFPVFAKGKGPTVATDEVDTKIDSFAKFGTSIDALLRNFAAGRAPENTFIFDITGLYNQVHCKPSEMQAKLSRPLERTFLRRADKYLKGKDQIITNQFVQSLMNKIQLVAVTKHKDADVLLTAPFFRPFKEGAEKEEKDRLKPNELALMDKVSQKDRGVFLEHGAHDDKKLDSAMIESGARMDPITTKETLLKVAKPDQLLGAQGIKKATLTTKGDKVPTVFPTVKAFLKSSMFKKFRDLSGEKDAPPYQKFFPAATADLLEGLKDLDVDHVFQQKEITDVLQIAYYRIMNAMGGASAFRNDLIEFMNNIELIHDQLQMILAIVAPYQQNNDFSKAIKEYIKTPPDGTDGGETSLPVPKGVDPKVHHKPSAMHSVASVLSSVEAQKQKDKGSRSLNALVLKDNYYEAHGAIHNSKTYDVSILDGYKLSEEKEKAKKRREARKSRPKKKARAKTSPQTPESGTTGEVSVPTGFKPTKEKPSVIDKAFENGKKPAGLIDIFICDFHHNISVERSEYHLEDISGHVDTLYKQGLVADKFTVAIDCTVDFIRSEDVRKFLQHNQKRIKKGEMNVVLYRSAQKFDMLGMDNYYGGFTITINDGTSYDDFNKRMDKVEDQSKGLSHQGLTHLVTHGAKHLDGYREALMANTQLLYQRLPSVCKDDPTSPLHIGETSDPRAVFLDIQFPGRSEKFATGDFYQHFLQWAVSEGLAFTTRPSFGFATTNFTTIAGSKVRLNPGLESDDAINKYVAYFTRVQQLLAKTENAYVASLGTERSKMSAEFLDKISLEALQKWEVPALDLSGQKKKRRLGGTIGSTSSGSTGSTGSSKNPTSEVVEEVQHDDALPAPAAIDFHDLSNPNPTLYFQINNANGYNFRVDSHHPGGDWIKVEQFCSYLAVHWLTNGHGAGGLKLSDLDGDARNTAVQTLIAWGSAGGVMAQQRQALQRLAGADVNQVKVAQDATNAAHPAGTRIWFGTDAHAQAAVVLPTGNYLVYDPNTGNTQQKNGVQFTAYIQHETSFVVS